VSVFRITSLGVAHFDVTITRRFFHSGATHRRPRSGIATARNVFELVESAHVIVSDKLGFLLQVPTFRLAMDPSSYLVAFWVWVQRSATVSISFA